jgi:peptidoglycan/xylan/chitin deacetylase (PgdA/CDA1 family)
VLDDREFECSSSLPGVRVRQRTFDRFLAWASRNCEIIDLGKGVPDWRRAPAHPRVALTFDDGWLDNHRFAAPIAARYGASMTVFICPGLIGCHYPFWPERVLRTLATRQHAAPGSAEATIERLKLMDPAARQDWIEKLESMAEDPRPTTHEEPTNATMDWGDIRELHQCGVRFGSHTLNHTILTQIPLDTATREVLESRVQIEENLHGGCEMFAYPNGNWNVEVRQILAKADFRLAFTTRPGEWTAATDPLLIPRTNISENHLVGPTGRFSPAVFEYAAFWRGRHTPA